MRVRNRVNVKPPPPYSNRRDRVAGMRGVDLAAREQSSALPDVRFHQPKLLEKARHSGHDFHFMAKPIEPGSRDRFSCLESVVQRMHERVMMASHTATLILMLPLFLFEAWIVAGLRGNRLKTSRTNRIGRGIWIHTPHERSCRHEKPPIR